jgi:threonine dehydrogenase-like Zn-dependent dehydrogenase
MPGLPANRGRCTTLDHPHANRGEVRRAGRPEIRCGPARRPPAEPLRRWVSYGPRDVRFEERAEPKIIEPTDAVIRISATCVCGSDLWPYRGISAYGQPTPMGHEYCGIVEEVGGAVSSVKRGQFVIGSFFASDNSCPHCHNGYQTSCQRREFVGGAQSPLLRVPLADGTLVATPEVPREDLVPNLLATSDVLGTGWFAADAANVKPGGTAVVVGDGAVGLLGVLSAKQMGAERIIAMSSHEARQKLAREFGATDIVTVRGDEGVARIKELTKGIGADSVLECVGTQESMMQAIGSTRPGGSVGYVGMPHGVELEGEDLFFRHVHLHGGPAPVRRYLPKLIELVWERKIDPGKVFDPAARPSGGGLPRHGRTSRHQNAAAPVGRVEPPGDLRGSHVAFFTEAARWIVHRRSLARRRSLFGRPRPCTRTTFSRRRSVHA